MKSWSAVALTALALTAVPAAAQNWNAEYARTEQGHRIGNPEAPIQLIESVSYTCPHCAHFEQESEPELRYFYVHEGHAAVEIRHLIRNIVDVAAALTAECGPDENFFGNHRVLLHTHDEWMVRGGALSQAQQARWNSGGIPQRMRAIASDLDFYELMEPRGYTRTQVDACLSDQARAEAIVTASQANAAEFGVAGTPSFVINGTLAEGVHGWDPLREILATMREQSSEASQ